MDKLTHPILTLLLAATIPAQDLPLSPALERAIAADELEHDVARAKDLLRAVAEDQAAPDAVRRHAWLRLARLQRRTGEDASDALARAGVGDDAVAVAARALQAQGQADPEREAELQAKAEAAVEAAIQHGSFQDALWFGAAAVPVAIRKFEERFQPLQPVEPELTGLGPMGEVLAAQAQQRQRSAAILWSLPGDRVAGFLREGLQSTDVRRRRALAAGIQQDSAVGRLDLVRLALRDSDADVVVPALRVGFMTSCQDLLPLAVDPRDQVRPLALSALDRWCGSRFKQAPATPERRADCDAIAAALPRLLAATSRAEHSYAVSLASVSCAFSRAGRVALAAQLERVRGAQPLNLNRPQGGLVDEDGDAENATVLREAFVRLGAIEGEWSTAQILAANLADLYLSSAWGRSALDAALTAWRLGYARASAQWLGIHAKGEDAGAVVAGLAGNGQALRHASPWLHAHDLPDAAFGPLRDALSSAPSLQYDAALVLAIGRTGHADAPALLRTIAQERKDYAGVVVQAMTWIVSKRPGVETFAALRAQLAALLPLHDGSPRSETAAAVGTLVRLGDMEIIGMFDDLAGAFSYVRNEGGVAQGQQTKFDVSSLPAGDAFRNPLTLASPFDWLILGRRKDTPGRWHGYSPEQYRAIWRRVLAPTDGKHGAAWAHASRALAPLPDAAGADPLLVQAIVEAAQARVGEVEATTVTGVLAVLFEALERDTVPESLRVWVRELREAAFGAPNGDVRAAAMASLAVPFDANDRAHLLRGLADPSFYVNQAARRPFEAQLVPVDREVVEHAFRAPHVGSRQQAFPLLRRIRNDVPDILRGLLADPDEEIRWAACSELAHSLRLDAVPALLEALKDQAPRVREAATQSLQAIRFYHDEKAHWDRVFDGRAGLTATSAAAALLEQAKPANDAASRILAIRSLGVLGAPETQPFLIEWTKDANAEVAAAAREAVGRIHARK